MSSRDRWLIASTVPLLVLAGSWALLDRLTSLSEDAVVTWAGALMAVAAAPLMAWAALNQRSAWSSPTTTGDDTAMAEPKRVRVGRVPDPADCFQHRAIADTIDQALLHGNAAQVLTGPGGVGKTQIAAEVARRWESRGLDVLVWITATDTQAIVSAYAQAGIDILDADAADAARAAAQFLDWLARTPRRWLVVLDDLALATDLDAWRPPNTSTGWVMITTQRRDATLYYYGRVVTQVELFTPAEAGAYLAEKFRRHPGPLAETARLARELGNLPLALSQAAAYIIDRNIDVDTYLARLAEQDLHQMAPGPGALPDAYPRPLAATVELSVAAADQLNPAGLARPMLVLLSVLDPNGVPVAVLTSPPVLEFLAKHRTGEPSSTPVTAHDARDAVTCLHRLNLVATEADQAVVRVHGLVQHVARDYARDLLESAMLCAADALLSAWPAVGRDLALPGFFIANTAVLQGHAKHRLWQQMAHPVLFQAGQSLGEAGLVATAVTHFKRLASSATRMLGVDHPDTLRARRELAYWRGQAGDVTAATADTRTLLADHVRVLGPDHPDTLRVRSGLALWLGQSGHPDEALGITEALLADRLRVLGPEDRDTLLTRLNLAYWRGQTGDIAGALELSQALRADYLRVFGPDDRDTLRARLNLAGWRGWAGDAAGAEAALHELLADYLRVLGPDHPYTLRVRHWHAYWRGQAGHLRDAVGEFETLLADCERLLSPGHSLLGMVRDGMRQAQDALATSRQRWWLPRPRRGGMRGRTKQR